MLVDVAATLGSGSDTVRPVQPPSPAATAMATMSMPGGSAKNLVCMRGIDGVGSHEYEQLGRLSAARPIRPANYRKSGPACRAPVGDGIPFAALERRENTKGAMRLTRRPRPSDCPRLCWASATAAETGADRLGLARDQAFALRPLARQLARTAYRLGAFTRLFLRWLLVMPAKLHFAENALALHLLLERLEGLIDVIVPDENLHASFLFENSWMAASQYRAPRMRRCQAPASSRPEAKSPPMILSCSAASCRSIHGATTASNILRSGHSAERPIWPPPELTHAPWTRAPPPNSRSSSRPSPPRAGRRCPPCPGEFAADSRKQLSGRELTLETPASRDPSCGLDGRRSCRRGGRRCPASSASGRSSP